MRGEKPYPTPTNPGTPGSPPHARGKASGCLRRTGSAGITPACAGKSARAVSMRAALRDHPRMRGEKDLILIMTVEPGGSPPHARGKALMPSAVKALSGITPACAGKSNPPVRHAGQTGDHPRMRGEKSKCGSGRRSGRGSPPHARGKESSSWTAARSPGITPACAGKSRQNY